MVSLDDLAALPPALLEAVRRNAESQATLTAACLKLLDQRVRDAGHADGCSGLPKAFLLEFAAIAQLRYWESQGLRDLLPPGVPDAAEASSDLFHRATTDPKQFWQAENNTLACQVMQIWIGNFHWLEPGLIEANIIIGEADEDALIEALAQLLWQHRHEAVPDSDLEHDTQQKG